MELENQQYEGYRAAMNGESIDSSPYAPGLQVNDDWVSGFMLGLEDL